MNDKKSAINVEIRGLVQGVGFRPFVYRVARELGLSGTVRNRTDGVRIHAEGSRDSLERFITILRTDSPPASSVDYLSVTETPSIGAEEFVIVPSEDNSDEVTRVSPDLPVCAECLGEIRARAGDGTPARDDGQATLPPVSVARRGTYAFTNCTNCGPRFSIVKSLPYDRPNTTMSEFEMCDDCRSEYHDAGDRRFHAQPVACRVCGPEYTLESTTAQSEAGSRSGENAEPSSDQRRDAAAARADRSPEVDAVRDIELVRSLADAIEQGRIVAMKGIGGYHLACDAFDEDAVAELRRRKRREAKPFAVMFRDTATARRYAAVSPAEASLLESSARPIVLLKAAGPAGASERAASDEPHAALAPSVSNGLHTLGAMLPYMPMHHLLLDLLRTPSIVLTSGNLSSEPIVTSNSAARQVLGPISDLLLSHNRDIHNRLDDSVAMVAGSRTRVIRRSRGYVPNPVRLPFEVDGIVAVGPEQKSTFCFGTGHDAILSQHLGDLNDASTLEFAEEVLERFPRLFRVRPVLIARDRHPDYLSSDLADGMGLPVVEVGHHHAHVASCMAEHGLEGEVIGVALDGTGLGDDGAIWGGEVLISDYSAFSRFAHFDYVPLPGGDLAADHPWRSALTYLMRAFGPDGPPPAMRRRLPLFDDALVAPEEREAVLHAIRREINAPQTSSAGRLFDAVSAICGVCLQASFDAEAPIRLADLLAEDVAGGYDFEIVGNEERRIQFDAAIRQIAREVVNGEPVSLISARFHNTICQSIARIASEARNDRGLHRVVLSGGVFQNRYILEETEQLLLREGFEVYSHEAVPSNDGGIALGQLAVAAATRRERE